MEISAAELIRYETLPEELVGFLSHECCSGLSFLHRQGVIHRSVRAEHIYLDRQGHVKLGAHSLALTKALAIYIRIIRWFRKLRGAGLREDNDWNCGCGTMDGTGSHVRCRVCH